LEVCVISFYTFNRFLMPNSFDSISDARPVSETAAVACFPCQSLATAADPLPTYVLTREREHALWKELQDELLRLTFEPHLTEAQPAFIAAPSREYLETVERS
jgi:hypothetical protein